MVKSSDLEKGITLHEFQSTAWVSPTRYLGLISGVQAGKTIFGCYWIGREITQGGEADHLVLFPTYKIGNQSTLKDFLAFNRYFGWGEWKKMDSVLKCHNGANVFCRSVERPQDIVGIPAKSVWADEAGMMTLSAWLNMQDRVSKTGGKILLTTTPYACNWLYHDFYNSWLQSDPEYQVVQFPSDANPTFPRKEMAKKRQKLSPEAFAMRYLGQFRKMQGLVYPSWRAVKRLPPKKFWQRVAAGVDFGYTNPAAMLVLIESYLPDNSGELHYFLADEWYQTQKLIGDIIAQGKLLKTKWGIETFYCDPSEPDYIADMCLADLNAIAGESRKSLGLQRCAGGFASGKILVLQDLPNLTDEIEVYHRPPEGETKSEMPIAKYDHLMDCVLYGFMGMSTGELASASQREEAAATEESNYFRERERGRLWR